MAVQCFKPSKGICMRSMKTPSTTSKTLVFVSLKFSASFPMRFRYARHAFFDCHEREVNIGNFTLEVKRYKTRY